MARLASKINLTVGKRVVLTLGEGAWPRPGGRRAGEVVKVARRAG
jgi:hypothetical protein